MIRTPAGMLALTAAFALTAGCTPTDPKGKDAPLPTRPFAEVTQQAEADAKIITDAAPDAEKSLWTATPAPCTGQNGEFADDDRWYLAAGFVLDVPPSDQFTTLGRIKTALQNKGWVITGEESFADGTRGDLTAHNPATGHTTNLFTTKDRTGIAVSVDSPCYMPSPGENPLKG
ncbi:hypothetical protein [Actinoplanes utahensis]|uniref:Lipoprotein n=1 Tax=Actinoplanes utahensis TaxID=1869 RepID=A0A0A6UQY7_ACTUT|nr:hypothetical protein [Actinoplanes utahensis]KHD77826.1 hypothetical protein MB27_08510 [Actinoplanes utahensis]GIF32504.1 hypothetical protein Aut01nite_54900 [Actinoplanes utahensis]